MALEDVRQQEKADSCHICGLPKAICREKATERDVQVDVDRCHIATAVAMKREELSQESSGVAAMKHMEAVEFIPELPNPAAGLGLPG